QADKMERDEILGWTQFCAWAALLMNPVIWWLQGPSVSTDQFVVRTALVVCAATGGIGLRIRALNSTEADLGVRDTRESILAHGAEDYLIPVGRANELRLTAREASGERGIRPPEGSFPALPI